MSVDEVEPIEEEAADENAVAPQGTHLASTQTVTREYLTQSGLPQSILNKIWELADVDKDGMLNEYEFIVATHLALVVQKLVSDGLRA